MRFHVIQQTLQNMNFMNDIHALNNLLSDFDRKSFIINSLTIYIFNSNLKNE